MPRKKLSSHQSRSRYPEGLSSKLKSYFFHGVALSGGKTDKTSVATLEYFTKENKIFLHGLVSKIKTDKSQTADDKLVTLLSKHKDTKYIALNSPLALPKCINCKLRCPGIKKCKEPEILWQWSAHQEITKKKKKKKVFTPYTQRCSEVYISDLLEEKFDVPHAMGANYAPLLARALFIKRRLKTKVIEAYPKLSLWRVGRSLRIQKSYLRFYKHSINGEEIRESIINQFIKSEVCFIYEEDKRVLIEDHQSFDAFICALTAVLKYKKQVESRPKGFPAKESWIEVPQIELNF